MTFEESKSPDENYLMVAELFLFFACTAASGETLQALHAWSIHWIFIPQLIIPAAANALIAIVSGYSLLDLAYSLWIQHAEGEVISELAENTAVVLAFLVFLSATFSMMLITLSANLGLLIMYAPTIMSVAFLFLSVSKKQEPRTGAGSPQT